MVMMDPGHLLQDEGAQRYGFSWPLQREETLQELTTDAMAHGLPDSTDHL